MTDTFKKPSTFSELKSDHFDFDKHDKEACENSEPSII